MQNPDMGYSIKRQDGVYFCGKIYQHLGLKNYNLSNMPYYSLEVSHLILENLRQQIKYGISHIDECIESSSKRRTTVNAKPRSFQHFMYKCNRIMSNKLPKFKFSKYNIYYCSQSYILWVLPPKLDFPAIPHVDECAAIEAHAQNTILSAYSKIMRICPSKIKNNAVQVSASHIWWISDIWEWTWMPGYWILDPEIHASQV